MNLPAPGGGDPARRLIVNADDFGASAGVNVGVATAHDRGVVTSASLMVRMPGAREAALMALDRPTLSLGLHADLTGEGTEAPSDVSDPRACRREILSQLHRFEDLLQRPPSHLDAHHNVFRLAHLEPIFVEIAAEHALPLREHSEVAYLPDFYGQWDDGGTHLEWISAENLIAIIDRCVGPGITELACHPGYVDPTFNSSYHAEREVELEALCDPMVRRHLDEAGFALVNYDDVESTVGGQGG